MKLMFLEHIAEVGRKPLCCTISCGLIISNDLQQFDLPVGYTPKEYEEFLQSINFEYQREHIIKGNMWFLTGKSIYTYSRIERKVEDSTADEIYKEFGISVPRFHWNYRSTFDVQKIPDYLQVSKS